MNEKKDLRAQARRVAQRERHRAATLNPAICDHVARSESFRRARWIGVYSNLPGEVDLRPLWKLRPAQCVFPLANPADRTMAFYRISSLENLLSGLAGILEPAPIEAHRVASWSSSDLILVPGLVFDRDGARIGSGHGYYDRFLAGCPAARWGLCFGWQLAKEKLAQEPTDVRMQKLVWEDGIFDAGGF